MYIEEIQGQINIDNYLFIYLLIVIYFFKLSGSFKKFYIRMHTF